jgi:hypothetical protein
MNDKTTIQSATIEIEERTRSYLRLSFSRALRKNHDTLAQLEKHFVQWRIHSPLIEEEAARRIDHLTKLSKEIGSGGQRHE